MEQQTRTVNTISTGMAPIQEGVNVSTHRPNGTGGMDPGRDAEGS
jgi:hypothetical protein